MTTEIPVATPLCVSTDPPVGRHVVHAVQATFVGEHDRRGEVVEVEELRRSVLVVELQPHPGGERPHEAAGAVRRQ